MQSILTLVCLVFVVAGVLFGFLRRSNRTLVRLLTLVLSVLGAFFLAKVSMKYAGGYLIDAVKTALSDSPEIAELLTENPDFASSLLNVVQMLTAPVLFALFYIVLKIVTWIVFKIFCFILRIKGPKLFGRLIGAGVGLICGLVGVLVFVVPVCGYTSLVGDTIERLYPADQEQSESVTQIKELCALGDAPIASTVYNLLGDTLFDQLTTAEFDGKSVTLRDEIGSILTVLDNVKVLGENSIENYGEKESKAVSDMATGISDSALLSHLGSGILSGVSGAWLEGEEFLGVSRPSADEKTNGLLNGFLQVFSTSDASNIGQDLQTFTAIFDLMVKHDMFELLSGGAEENAFAEKLTAPGVIDEFYATLGANPRMAPVKAAIADVGVRLLMQQLGGAADELKENHGELLTDVANKLKSTVGEDGKVDAEALKGELNTVLGAHEIEVSDAAVQLVADGFADAFTGEELETMTTDELVDKLVERFASADLSAISESAEPSEEPAA